MTSRIPYHDLEDPVRQSEPDATVLAGASLEAAALRAVAGANLLDRRQVDPTLGVLQINILVVLKVEQPALPELL